MQLCDVFVCSFFCFWWGVTAIQQSQRFLGGSMCERTPLISLLISDYMFLLSKSLKWGTGSASDVFVSYLAEYINMFMMSYTAPPNTSDPTVMSKLTVGCAQWTFYDNQVTEYFLGFCACVCLLWVFFVVVVMCIYCGRAYNKKNSNFLSRDTLVWKLNMFGY